MKPSYMLAVASALALVSAWLGNSASAEDLATAHGPMRHAISQPSAFRDLNHNGRLDPYEDRHLSVRTRTEDLLARMTLQEKVALMLHGTLPAEGGARLGRGASYDRRAAAALIAEGLNNFITRLNTDPEQFAIENNAIQQIAERTRLGIPVTISTDPRNHFQAVVGASIVANGFSQWPEPLGLAALGSEQVVERFGQIAAREYRAVGIHMALSPQADLYTEPRWPRGTQTFGSDPETVSRLAEAYVRGFQGGSRGVTPEGVATVAKHWVGYGAAPNGFDGHNYYGRFGQLDPVSFRLHVAAFAGVLRARSAGIMPTYIIPEGAAVDGKPVPSVGGAFNKPLLSQLLRRTMKYRGLVISDWLVTDDCTGTCQNPSKEHPQGFNIAMPWGVEGLSKEDRFALAADAGIDQFGGVDDPEALLKAVHDGKVSIARVDQAASRVLMLKFELGLFENPYVDPTQAREIFGNSEARREADEAQRAAQVLLKNRDNLLPLAPGKRVWLSGVDPAALEGAGLTIVTRAEEADVAIVRVAAPFETLHPYSYFGKIQHEGSLEYKPDGSDARLIKLMASKVPTIVAVDLDRPAVLTEINNDAAALLALFGASDKALIDVIIGRSRPRGKLPLELPRSQKAVEGQNPAMPDDSANPLYRRGYGLKYHY